MTCEYVRFFMCVKSNEASRRNYRLLERRKREKREKCVRKLSLLLRQTYGILITIKCLDLYYEAKNGKGGINRIKAKRKNLNSQAKDLCVYIKFSVYCLALLIMQVV